jgi:hypothetical protein
MVYLFKIYVPKSLFRFIFVMFNERSLLVNESMKQCVFCCLFACTKGGDKYGSQMMCGRYLTGKDFND